MIDDRCQVSALDCLLKSGWTGIDGGPWTMDCGQYLRIYSVSIIP